MAAFHSHTTAMRSWRSQTGSNPACVRQLDVVRVIPAICAQITRKAKVDVDQPGCLRRGDP